MLTAVPKHWFSWDFEIQDDQGMPWGEVRISNWRPRGTISVAGIDYQVSRESARGAFLLEQGGTLLARAEKPSAFRRAFTIEHGPQAYALKARSSVKRELVLYADEREIGQIAPRGFFSRGARAELPERLPLVLRLFAVWLTLLIWKRQSKSS